MGTRANIIIEETMSLDTPVYLYIHSDGYPEEMVPLIAEFSKLYRERRGYFDIGHYAAQLLVFLVQRAAEDRLAYAEKERAYEENNPSMPKSTYIKQIFDTNGNDFLGFCIHPWINADIAYAYVIRDGAVEAYETPGDTTENRKLWDKLTTKPQDKMIFEGRIPKKWKPAKAA